MTEEIIIESRGWKGRGKEEVIEVNKKEQYVILRRWAKEKETGESYYTDVKVLVEDIEFLWGLLKEHCDIGQEYGSHYIWRLIIKNKNLAEKEGISEDYAVAHFTGFRQKRQGKDYIFKYYYNPISVLESLGFLHVYGRGGCMILNKEDLKINKYK